MEFIHNNQRTDINIAVLLKHYTKDEVKKIYKDKLSDSQMKEVLDMFQGGNIKEEKRGDK